MPFPLLDSASLVIARAIETDALDLPVSYKSLRDFLERPQLGNTGRIDIPWKKRFLNEPLFPLKYKTFWEIWHRCLYVIGIRENKRPYSLRIGAGARMNGTLLLELCRRWTSIDTCSADGLSSALRNYVMGHTEAVFQSNYQTSVVRADLTTIAFGPKAVGRDETLFNQLRNMTLTRDEGAPTKVSEAQIAKFQERNDITKLRDEIQHTTDKLEKRRLRSQIRSITGTCKRLQLKADREAYFKEADRLRLQGHQPTPAPDRGGPGIAAPVATCLARWEPRDRGEFLTNSTRISEQYIDAQLLYLSSTVSTARQRVPEAAAAVAAAPSKPHGASRCFVCLRGFPNRTSLTRHFRDIHLRDGTFNNPFSCRECRRTDTAEAVVHGPAEWCNHLEHTHGRTHTPRFNQGASYQDCLSNSPLACLLCEAPMKSISTLLAHMNRTEIPRYRKSVHLACSACTREGVVDAKPMSLWEWLTHALAVHEWALPGLVPCLLCGQLCSQGRGLRKHLTTQHRDERGEHWDCAACLASTVPAGKTQCTHNFEELLRHGVGKHPFGQLVVDDTVGKRKRDGGTGGEQTAPAPKRIKGDGDEKCPAPPTDGKRANSKRVAANKVVCKKELSPAAIYNADSDPCEDVIICAGPDSGFLGNIDPALLAPRRTGSAVHHTAAILSDLPTPEALKRPRRYRGPVP